MRKVFNVPVISIYCMYSTLRVLAGDTYMSLVVRCVAHIAVKRHGHCAGYMTMYALA